MAGPDEPGASTTPAVNIEIADGGDRSGTGDGDGDGGGQDGPRLTIAVDLHEDEERDAEAAGSPTAGTGAQPVGGTTAAGGAPSTSTSLPDPSVRPTGPARSVVAHAAVPQVVARSQPSDDAPPVAALANPTEVGSPLVFLVEDSGNAEPGWIQVQLPIQPNGTTGWVRRSEVTLYANDYRIEIDRSAHRLRVFDGGRLWIETPIAVGTGATPTPVGEFYLLELLSPPDPTGPYGPYAFGLSGFSEVLESFGGADTAIIGLHGTDDPSAIGTDVSFGCVRMANDVITELAAVVPLGTPVVIS